jgi:serine/threonine protein kinase
MEYGEGNHSGQAFKRSERASERLSPPLIARIGADAATALHYAHELTSSQGKPLGIVHRDISPANIMVSYDGVVKLCDFGIAKAAAFSDQLTQPGQVKGKYAYMSPEQTVAAPLDGRSDVFSLAIVLWELLAGKTIVSRGDPVDAMRAIRDGKLPPLDKAAPGTPEPLVKAITWALETKRERRASAADLATALEAFIKASPEAVTRAAAGATIPSDFRVSITTAPGAGAYPISSFTWLLLYSAPADTTRSKMIVDFMTWALTDGQTFATDLGYAPVPGSVVQQATAALATIKVS